LAKKKHRTPTAPPGPVVKGRAEKAIREGRFQQALELTKQLYKAEPTPAHQELVRQAYLGRASQLRTQGNPRDALTVLQAALVFDHTTPVWLEQVAVELARCGEVKRALELLAQAPDSTALAPVMAGAADAALQQEAAGRVLLPESLHADFDRIVLAFRQTEAGQDDDARATLQGIGLRSPFLEWKLLLRGFQAYYTNNDARALENWQRLAPDRLPVRLAAPFRFQIDAEFRAAQASETQTALQRQLDRVEGGAALLPQLRKLRGALTNPESLVAAFRQAEALLPALRREAPQLEARLASCFYWATLNTGPEDVLRYKRVFGRPAADPNFSRLEALANEPGGYPQDAHKNWQKFEKEIADDPKAWPPGQVERVRALIWLRMGRNAAGIPDDKEAAKLPAFLRDHPDRPLPLNPSAEKCYRRALELAPDLLEAHEGLIQLHRRAGRNAKAEQAARRLLEQFPDHLPTLEALSDLLLEKGEILEALELLQRAEKANPLNREVRGKVATAHLLAARGYSLTDQFEEARREYQAVLNLYDPAEAYTALGRWAACEFRAGQTERAEELLGQAKARAPSALAVAYLMLVESVRLKLAPRLKSRFDKEFKAGLEEPAAAAAAAAVVSFTHALMKMKVVYYGQKTHVKKVLAYVEKAAGADFTESQMEQVCTALVDLNAIRAARRYLDAAVRRFPANPHFPYLIAVTYMRGDVERAPVWQVRPMLEDARRLAEAMPPDARRDKLLRDIQERLSALAAANPFAMGFMPDFFGRMFDEGYDDFDD
jgi:tetratricopeptide (TPR) repeat protein